MPVQNINWKTLIDSLLNDNNLKYEVELKKDRLAIYANEADAKIIQKKLLDTLQSPAAFRANLPYIIYRENIQNDQPNDASINIQQALIPPADTVEGNKQILKNLFGEDPLSAYALDINAMFTGNAGIENGVLYSKEAKSERIAELWLNALTELLKRFNGIGLAAIHAAWNGSQPLPEAKSGEYIDESSVLAEGLLLPCFRQQGNRVCFDLKRLYELIAPPQILLQQNSATTSSLLNYELTLDKGHLFSYVQQCAGGQLLRLYKDKHEAESANAQLIILDRASAIAKPNYFTFILDHSLSMGENDGFDLFKARMLEVIKKIEEFDPKAKIRVVWFSSKADVAIEYDLKQDKIEQKIAADFAAMKADGNTRLSHTILDELNYSKNYNLSKQYNHVVVTFTDGIDNEDTVTEDSLQSKIKDFDKNAVPFMVMVGSGVRCDSVMLGNLARATGSSYTQLEKPEEIEQILGPVTTNTARKLKELLIELTHPSGETEIVFSGTVSQHEASAPQLPDVVIPFRPDTKATLTADGKKLMINIPDFSKITVANSTDLLRELNQRLHEIVNRSADSETQVVITELTQLRDVLTNLPDLGAENTHKGQLLGELNDYLNKFEQSLVNKGYEVSARALVGLNSGIINRIPVLQPPNSQFSKVTENVNRLKL